MAIIVVSALLAHDPALASEPVIRCGVVGSGDMLTVVIRLKTPHAGEMALQTPDRRTIWLQASHIPFQFPATDNFELLPELVLDRQARGSWFNDWGEPEAVPVLSGPGTYVIVVADDLAADVSESEHDRCEFTLPGR